MGIQVYTLDCFRGEEFKRALSFYINGGDNSDQLPNDIVDVPVSVWELSGSAVFPNSGVRFNWTIEADARNHADFEVVGSATNSVGDNFLIRKDREHHLFTTDDGNGCNTVYFCTKI